MRVITTDEEFIERMNNLNLAGDMINKDWKRIAVPPGSDMGCSIMFFREGMMIMPMTNIRDDVLLCNFKTAEKLWRIKTSDGLCHSFDRYEILTTDKLPFIIDPEQMTLDKVDIKDKSDRCESWGDDA